MSGFLTKIAHNNRVSLGRPSHTANLAEVIASEKRLIEESLRLSAARAKSTEALKEWALAEQGDLPDVVQKVAKLFDYLAEGEARAAAHLSNFRLFFKSIRSHEEHLALLKGKKDSLHSKIDTLEKRVARMKEEHKDLPDSLQRLRELRQEFDGLEHSVINEETKLGDFKRSETKQALSLKLGALLELAERSTICAELGKLMIESIDLTPTEPGRPRAVYRDAAKTESILLEAQRCIAEVVFSPLAHGDDERDGLGREAAREDERDYDEEDRRARQYGEDDTRVSPAGGSFYQQQQTRDRTSAHEPPPRRSQEQAPEQSRYYSGPADHQSVDQELSYARERAQQDEDDLHARRGGAHFESTRALPPALPPVLQTPVGTEGNDEGLMSPAMREYAEGAREADYPAQSRYGGGSPRHAAPPVRHTSPTPIYQTLSTSNRASPIDAETNFARASERAAPSDPRAQLAVDEDDPHRSSLAYFGTPETQDQEFPVTPTNTSSPYPLRHSREVDEQDSPHEPAATHQRDPAQAETVAREETPAPRAPAPPASGYYTEQFERPYVPREGDGAYHPPSSAPPAAIFIPASPPAVSPILFSPTTANNTAMNAARTLPYVSRGESALGSKLGDLGPSSAAPASSSNNFQPTPTSGYNSREQERKINAGAFRRSQAFGDRTGDRYAAAAGPAGGQSQAEVIRDSYRASMQFNNPAAPLDDFGTRGDGASPGLPPGAGGRFEVSPLVVDKRRPSGNVSDRLPATTPGGGADEDYLPPPPRYAGDDRPTSSSGSARSGGFGSSQFVTRLD